MDDPAADPLDQAFAAELAACRPTVVRWCRAWSSDAARGEEVAQTALHLAWEKRTTFRRESTVRAFVAGIARNLCRNEARKISEVLSEDGVVDATSPEGSALQGLRREEQEEVLLRAMADLPTDEQDALYARYVDGVSRRDLAERLGLDDDGARVVLQRARRRLERVLRRNLATLAVGSSFFEPSSS